MWQEQVRMTYRKLESLSFPSQRTHVQSRRFWSLYVSTFEYFIWNYGVMKDYPMKVTCDHIMYK